MNGSVVKKGKRWYVITEGPRDRDTGKRKRDWTRGFRTKREAEAERVEILRRKHRGTFVERSSQTLGDYLTQVWLPSTAASVRPSTLQSYEQTIRSYILPRLGTPRLQEVTAPTINSLYAYLLRKGRVRQPGGLSKKTVRNVHVVLHKALQDAVEWSLLSVNPASKARPPTPDQAPSRDLITWSVSELRRFLDHAHLSAPALFPAILTTAATGMRRGEVLGLRWRDVDLDGRRLSIRQTLISVSYEIRYSTPKTKRGRRSVTIDHHTVAALREHRASQLRQRLTAGPAWEDSDLVFCQADGTPIHPDYFSHAFTRIVETSGLPRIRLHDLRHTHATLALQAGIHPKVVSERLGHANTSITMDIYSHVTPSMQEEVAELVSGLLFDGG